MANVLANDRIDGVRATVSTVVLSQVSSTESHVVLDAADGSVDVTTGAALGTHTLVYTICNTGAVNVKTKTNSGIYALTYRICEAASPTNCDTAVATVGAWPVYSRARRDAVGLGVAPASPRCPMISLTSVTRDSLEAFTIAVFRALGLTDEDAAIFGRALVFSELRFHPGHGQGVKRLRRYQQRIGERQVDPTARWEIVKESPALALVDAHNGIGTVAAAKAMRLAIEKAKVCGIGQVVVRNSTHFGSSAVHACQASDAGCLGIAFTNAGPEMAPWGAREGAVGTNPWGIAAPTGLGFPAVLDIALTTAGKGMMQWHAREGRPMPLDWALTPDGRETDDPNTAMTGALLGIGTYKGYGLAFMTDVLTGVIGGGGYGLTPYADPAKLDVSHTLTAIDIAWFMPLAEFTRRMDDFARMVKSRARRPGVAEVLIPGEQEARRVAKKSAGGVPLDDEVLADLQALGRDLGLTETLAIVGPWREPTL